MSFACECGVERALQKVWHRSLSRKALALGLSAYLTQVARTLWAWGTQRPMRLPCVGVHLRAWDWRIPWWLQRYIHSNNFNDCF